VTLLPYSVLRLLDDRATPEAAVKAFEKSAEFGGHFSDGSMELERADALGRWMNALGAAAINECMARRVMPDDATDFSAARCDAIREAEKVYDALIIKKRPN